MLTLKRKPLPRGGREGDGGKKLNGEEETRKKRRGKTDEKSKEKGRKQK
jgi:hypothetical protein